MASGKPSLRRVLIKTWGKQLFLAGLFKLLWSVCVIMGAFFFVRTLQFVSGIARLLAPAESCAAGLLLSLSDAPHLYLLV